MKRGRILKVGLGILVAVLCFAWVLHGIKFEEVAASFKRANYASLPVLLAFLALFFWSKAYRWTLLLRPLQKLKTGQVFPAMMIGFMGNNLLPAHLGEFARVFVLGKQYKLSKAAVFSTVVLERVFDVVAILFCFAVSLFFVEGLSDNYRANAMYLSGVIVVGVFVLGAYVIWTEPFVRMTEWLMERVPIVPTGLRSRLIQVLRVGAEGLTTMRDAKLVLGITVVSLLHWSLNGVMICVSLWAFGLWAFGIHGIIESPILASFVVLGVTALGVTIPATPGFFGLIQACFYVSLTPFGVSQADAFATSVYYHMVWYIPVTAVGLYYLYRFGLRLGQIEQESIQDET